MARPIGFEPTTCSFGGCHSIQLSYGRTGLILQDTSVQWGLVVATRRTRTGRPLDFGK